MKFNPNVEFAANIFALILKYIGLIVGAILLCYSIYLFVDGDREFAASMMFYGAISIVVALFIYYLLTLLIHIALTFNNIHAIADNFTMEGLLHAIDNVSEGIKMQSEAPIVKYEQPVMIKVKEPITVEREGTLATEMDETNYPDVIVLIQKGHIQMARHILITEKHLSMANADSYIQKYTPR